MSVLLMIVVLAGFPGLRAPQSGLKAAVKFDGVYAPVVKKGKGKVGTDERPKKLLPVPRKKKAVVNNDDDLKPLEGADAIVPTFDQWYEGNLAELQPLPELAAGVYLPECVLISYGEPSRVV